MSNSIVALVPISDYVQENVDQAVETGISLLGGISRFVSPDEKILLKPNLLSGALPQRAITTHPAVFSAVAGLLRKEGFANIVFGDSPGSPVTSSPKAASIAGISAEAARLDIPQADFENGDFVTYPEGRRAHSFCLCKGVLEADAMINLCKMKTHALERITGAVKNIYGCVCGVNKAAGHAAYPDSTVFAEMLTDLHRYIRPRLHIMDGITAMEGNGPTSGTPVNMNVLLFSADPVALDTVFCHLISLDPETVPTCVCGQEAGIGTMRAEEITVRTPDGDITPQEAAARYGKPDFNVDRNELKRSLFMKLMPLLPALQPRPKVNKSACVGCGVCMEACPVPEKAVTSGNGKKAVYNYKRCIRCFCCQEMCPAKAITVHRSALLKKLSGSN